MAETTRDRILDAALRAYGTEGFAVTSLDALADQLGIRKQTILYYFPSKHAVFEAVIDAGKTSAPIMILLVTAGMYSRFLALADIQTIIKDSLLSLGIGAFGIAVMMIVLWLLLGMILDSISIILLTVPIFATFAPLLGMDGFAFAIFGILLIEAGLLTPPFGLVVYVVKGAVPDSGVSLAEIFRGSIPYWILMLITAGLIWIFPGIASWLTTFI